MLWLPTAPTRVGASMCCRCSSRPTGPIAEFGRDGRRLRPNIVIGGVEGLDERSWPGKILQIADVEDRPRFDAGAVSDDDGRPDRLHRDPDVLKDIYRRLGGHLALNAAVRRPGTIRVGDRARIVDTPTG